MSQNRHFSQLKSLIIVILLILIGIQGYFLWQGHQEQPGQRESTSSNQVPGAQAPSSGQPKTLPGKSAPVEAVSFQQRGEVVFVAFNKPIGEAESSGDLANAPFDVDPPAAGQWNWMGPYVLRFKASGKNAFDPSLTYSFTARPERFLPSGETFAGRTGFEVRGSLLNVYNWSAELEPVPGQPGQYVIAWDIHFNRAVSPKDALQGFRLIDPKLGEASPVPLSSDRNPKKDPAPCAW